MRKYLFIMVLTLMFCNVSYGQQNNHSKLKQSLQIYPILAWVHVPNNLLKGVAEDNFNVAGFINRSQILQVERLGMKAILQDTNHKPWSKMTDKEIDSTVKKLIGNTKDNPSIKSWRRRNN